MTEASATTAQDQLRAYATEHEASGWVDLPRVEREAADLIDRLQASELAWKLIAKQNDRWNALSQSEKEAVLTKALDDEIADHEKTLARQQALPAQGDTRRADKAMEQIWAEWFTFYQGHFRGSGIAVSAADQRAFYEIAQPIMRALHHEQGAREP